MCASPARCQLSPAATAIVRDELPAAFTQHLQCFIYGSLQLTIETAQLVFRCVDHEHVWCNTEVLEVDAEVVRLRRIVRHDERARRPNAAAIDQLIATRRDDGCRCRIAYDAAETEVAERLRRHFAVGRAAMIDQHHLRPRNRLARTASCCGRVPAAVPVLVRPALEDVD